MSIVFIIVIVFSFLCFFVIQEEQRGIVLRFGKVLRDNNCSIVYKPGLHIKFPFIEQIKVFNTKIQTMNNSAHYFVLKEKQDLIIDSYVKWKISDVDRYYLATQGGNIAYVEMLLKKKFNDRLYSEIANLSFKEIVSDFKNNLTTHIKDVLNQGSINYFTNKTVKNINFNTFSHISNSHVKNVLTHINSISELGIQIVDIRIERINFPVKVSSAIYNRMKTECELEARIQKTMGQEQAEKLRINANYEAVKIFSEAHRQALIIKGEGEVIVSKLFANVFNKNPEFYSFIRSLQAYENIFLHSQNVMMINPNNNGFFRYMNIF